MSGSIETSKYCGSVAAHLGLEYTCVLGRRRRNVSYNHSGFNTEWLLFQWLELAGRRAAQHHPFGGPSPSHPAWLCWSPNISPEDFKRNKSSPIKNSLFHLKQRKGRVSSGSLVMEGD